ncbi:MAG: CAP domain-containing protein [Dehalococcoidia bacterium]
MAGALLLATACSESTPATPAATAITGEAPTIAAEALELVNGARLARDLAALENDAGLADLATAYSCRMATENFFSHTDPSGAAVDARMQAAGLSYLKVGENLARIENASDPAKVAVDGWLESPAHAENILRPDFTLSGMGVCGAGGALYFTQVFVEPAE